MCSTAELAADVARGTGCQLDFGVVWTSDACGPSSYLVSAGSSKSSATPTCTLSTTNTVSTRCCADTVVAAPASVAKDAAETTMPPLPDAATEAPTSTVLGTACVPTVTQVDNTAASIVGDWTLVDDSHKLIPSEGGSFLSHQSTVPVTAYVSYRPQFAEDATCEVYISYKASPSRSNSVRVAVTHAGGTTVVMVNQQLVPKPEDVTDRFMYIGEFVFGADATHGVDIDASASDDDKKTIADAVRFDRICTSPVRARRHVLAVQSAEETHPDAVATTPGVSYAGVVVLATLIGLAVFGGAKYVHKLSNRSRVATGEPASPAKRSVPPSPVTGAPVVASGGDFHWEVLQAELRRQAALTNGDASSDDVGSVFDHGITEPDYRYATQRNSVSRARSNSLNAEDNHGSNATSFV